MESRQWISFIPFAERPFDVSMVSSGDALFSLSVVILFFAHGFLRRSFLGRQFVFVTGIVDAIKLSTFLSIQKRSEDLNVLVQRWSCKTHTILTSWREFALTLEDVDVLLKLPIFGDFDLSATVLDLHVAEMAKLLTNFAVESAKHSCEKLAFGRFQQGHGAAASSAVKLCVLKDKSSKGPYPPKQKKPPKESVKYTYASWVRYFFTIFKWYVFHGPPWESTSPVVFTLVSLLAEGVSLPLASFYLDVAIVQMFLYERFPCYGLVQRIPKPLNENDLSLEYRIQGWFLGRPRQPLRLKASVIYYKSVKSASPPHNVFIMYKDPYYVTSIVTEFDKSDHGAPEASSKKRKFTSSQKEKNKVLQNVSEPSTKRFP
ncbi:Aminotransferase-like, plant mobile domain [Sesbania bispinosa]|nr:Aminotransferase-like, plant mobile domain [Sesbania bispinosa]